MIALNAFYGYIIRAEAALVNEFPSLIFRIAFSASLMYNAIVHPDVAQFGRALALGVLPTTSIRKFQTLKEALNTADFPLSFFFEMCYNKATTT